MSGHAIRMSYSDDGQANWSEWDEGDIGDVGEYGLRIFWTRLGRSRQRVYRFTCSSPRSRDVLALVGNFAPTEN